MAWTYELVDFALSEHAAPSVSTSVGNEPAGTLYDGTHDKPVPIHDANQLVKSSVSTNSSSVNSINLAISSTITPSHSTMLTDDAMSTNTIVLSCTPSVPSSQPRPHESTPSTSPKGLGHRRPELMGLTSALTGGKTRITTTTRRSMDWHFPGPFVSQLSLKSWTLKGVILWLYRCRPWCVNRPKNFWLRKLAHGREVYLIPTGEIATVVFITELLTQLRSRGVDLDCVSHSRARQDGKLLDKTNNTKYTLLNKSQTSSIAGCQLAQLIQTPNMKSPSSGINWQNYASEPVKTLVTPLHHPERFPRRLALRIHLSNEPSWTTQRAQHLHQHRHLILPACWSALPRSIHGWLNTCQPPWLCEPSPNGSKNFHCLSQRGKFSLKTVPRPKLGGHISPRKPLKLSNEWLSWWAYRLASWAKLWCVEPPTCHDRGDQSYQLTSSLASQKA